MADGRRGIFITLEGPDGAGKTTHAALLSKRIGPAVVATREPGGTPLGERIRDVLLSGESREPLADALLFNAARAELVRGVIAPALHGGAVVVCDRFADSTLAYQGYGGGVDLAALRSLADVATGGLAPDRTILFDIAPESGLARRAGGASSQVTRFESAHDLEFHRRVRQGFLALAAAEPDRWRVIDADRSADLVERDVWEAIEDLIRG